jgi:hypothetical protein
MVGIASDLGDHAVATPDDGDPSGVVTIARTGGEDDFPSVRHHASPAIQRVSAPR